MARIALSHVYDAPGRAVWRIATDFEAVARVSAPLVRFEGLPEGRLHQGQVVEVGVRLFGWLPPRPYRMEVLACDEAEMSFRSREMGAGVRRWDHSLRVHKVGTGGARLDETIEIDAGPMTAAYALWARTLYRHRHAGRLRLLAPKV